MSLFIAALNSGSNGNCYYIGNDEEAVLIDAGISCRETEKRMSRLGLSMNKVRAVFISHEHTDHISGLPVLAAKYRLPVYLTPATQHCGKFKLTAHLAVALKAGEPVRIGNLLVESFYKHHDAADPHSFTVSGNNVVIGIFTDIGQPCDQLIAHFSRCHAAFLEANYDEELLMNGRYPYFLKKRISGGKGHLSNRQALDLFVQHRPDYMSHLLLAHLSKDNNCPELVQKLFSEHAGNTLVSVASRYAATEVYTITAGAGVPAKTQVMKQAVLF